MPSFSTIVKSLALATLSLASASPIAAPPAPPAPDCKPVSKPSAPAPTIPSSGNTPDLNTTAQGTLQYVAIGRGTQNYTCSGAGANSTATGAIATLFDATTLAYADVNMLHAIPPMAVNVDLPADPSQFMTPSGALSLLGHHFFDIKGTPTFNLTAPNKILFAAKAFGVKAPANASKGPAGTGAVDWLQLTAKPAPYVSSGANMVYRVVTAGGNAPPCTKAESMTVQYAAEYWFYL